MAVGFDASSASITIDTPPSVLDPDISPQPLRPIHSLDTAVEDFIRLVAGNKAWFLSNRICATGRVNLTGVAGDDAARWELGFLQVRRVTTSWAWYKADWTDGAAANGGSILLQTGKPPAMPKQTCRDIGDGGPVGQMWYAPPGDARGSARAFPQTLTANFNDEPKTNFPAVLLNSLTKHPNFLRDAEVELLFCTALALREPGGRFHILKHFYWNVLWQATFQPADFANALYGPWLPVTVLRNAVDAHVSQVFDGPPDREPFRNALTSATETESCNDLLHKAYDSVLSPPFAGRRENRDRDHLFDVRA
ncbi:MAG TPA: hypothetical protein VMS17_02135 [Gemmataceae bacterium]|nr:hypothetical protein [Gemmataceae bacterium]